MPVITYSLDLANLDNLQKEFLLSLNTVTSTINNVRIQRCILIHNSGSLGDIKYIGSLDNLSSIRTTIDMNITSTIWLTSLFLQQLPTLLHHPTNQTKVPSSTESSTDSTSTTTSSSSSTTLPTVIINISSLAAIKPMKSMLLYCLGKAARDMLFTGLAAEVENFTIQNTTIPIKTLNYAPGPMDTDMQAELFNSTTMDPEMQVIFKGLKTNNVYVPLVASAAKCARLIAENKYSSGSHIDYYDPEL